MEFENPYIVYVRPNAAGYITAINSSAFLPDATGWVKIDSGYTDKYRHAQNHYFPKPVITEGGAYRYRLVGSDVVMCTGEEIAMQEKENASEEVSLENRVKVLEAGAVEMEKLITMFIEKTPQE